MSLLTALSAITPVQEAVHLTDWRGLFTGEALAVVHPASTAEIAACVAVCAAHGTPIVPVGGNTSLCGGATPRGGEVAIALDRLCRIRDTDAADMVMVAEAGVVLDAARAAAAAQGMALPVSLASGGSAQIGGMIATNAGGNSTLRYGNMREQVLGLEVVLPGGEIWHGLRRLRKDNTGLALRQLFIGAEGTLGIVTAACLRLVPAPVQREVAFCAVPTMNAVIALLRQVRAADEASLHAFEYLSATALGMAVAHIPGCADPMAAPSPAYALIELASSDRQACLRDRLASLLEEALAAGIITDAVVAGSEAQRASLWRLRESQAEAQARTGQNIKNDVSVPISAIPAFVSEASAACRVLSPDIRIADFGHAGDGNIHFNLISSTRLTPVRVDALVDAVTEVARTLGGSFSAEHGVGQLKTGLLAEWRAGPEMDLMRKVKQAIDPAGLMNPGKILR